MTEFEIIESLALHFDEYKHKYEMKPHWILLIKLFHQCSVGMINETLIKQSLPYQMCLYELGELFSTINNEALEIENKVLLVNKNVAQGIAKKFKEENDKHKKAIKLLKEKFVDVGLFIDCNNVGEYNFNRDSDEDRLSDFEFEFLKEVFENE